MHTQVHHCNYLKKLGITRLDPSGTHNLLHSLDVRKRKNQVPEGEQGQIESS